MFDSISAVGASLASGVLSSAGPCSVPRALVVASVCRAQQGARALAPSLAFVGGSIVAYAFFVTGSALISGLLNVSMLLYGALAAWLAVAGLRLLFAGCANHSDGDKPPVGAGFFLGAGLSAIVSPCCAPALIGIAAYRQQTGNTAFTVALVASYAVGHTLPAVVAAHAAGRVPNLLRNASLAQAVTIVNGALTLALCGYYAILA